MDQTLQIRARDWGFVSLLGLLWGANFFVNELALNGITPYCKKKKNCADGGDSR